MISKQPRPNIDDDWVGENIWRIGEGIVAYNF